MIFFTSSCSFTRFCFIAVFHVNLFFMTKVYGRPDSDQNERGDEFSESFSVPTSAGPDYVILKLKDFKEELSGTLIYEVTQMIKSPDVVTITEKSQYRCGQNICKNSFRCYFCLTIDGVYKTTSSFKGSVGENYQVSFKIKETGSWSKWNIIEPTVRISIVSPCSQKVFNDFSKNCSPGLFPLTANKASGFVKLLKFSTTDKYARIYTAKLYRRKLKYLPSSVKFSLMAFNNSKSRNFVYLARERLINLTSNRVTVFLNLTAAHSYTYLEARMLNSLDSNVEMKYGAVTLYAYNALVLCRKEKCAESYRLLNNETLRYGCQQGIPYKQEYDKCYVQATIGYMHNIQEGLKGQVEVRCLVTSVLNPVVSWYFVDGSWEQKMKSSGNVKVEGFSILFKPVSLEHTGKYKCVVTTEQGKVSSNVFSLVITGTFTFKLDLTVRNHNFSADLETRGSPAFNSLAHSISSSVSSAVKSRTVYYRIRAFSSGSIKAHGLLFTQMRSMSETLVKAYENLNNTLTDIASRSGFPNLSTNERDAAFSHNDICPAVVDRPLPGLTLHWPATQESGTARLTCPFDAGTSLYRVCTKDKFNIAIWDEYDAKPCKVPQNKYSTSSTFLRNGVSTSSISTAPSPISTVSSPTPSIHLLRTSIASSLEPSSSAINTIATSSITRSTSLVLQQTPTPAARRTVADKKLENLQMMLTQGNISDSEAQNVSTNLVSITKPTEKLSPYGINVATSILALLEGNVGRDKKVTENFMNVFDNLLNVDSDDMATSEKDHGTSERLKRMLGPIGVKVAMYGDYSVSQNKFAFGAVRKNALSFKGKHVSVAKEQGKPAIDIDGNRPSGSSTTGSITLPASLLNESGITSGNITVVLTTFVDTILFPTDSILRPKDDYPILAVEIPGYIFKGLIKPVVMKYTAYEPDAECGFWNHSKNDSGFWDTQGCIKVPSTDGKVHCECNHMTNFALLFGAKSSQSSAHKKALSILTYLGSGISLLGAGITFVTYAVHPKLRDSNPPKIMMNLLLALISLYVVFLAGVNRTETRTGCRIVAIALEYCFLSVFSWSLVEGFTSFRGIVRPMAQDIRKFMLKAMAIGWGVPFLLTTIGAAAWPNDYGSNESCVVQGLPLFITVIGPVGTVLIINYVALAGIMCSLNQSSKRYSHHSMTNRDRLRIIVAFILLFGLTWVFGLLVIDNDLLAFQYIFCILGCLHGLFIFLFYCVRNENARKAWVETLHIQRGTNYATSSSDTKKTDTHSESAT